MSWNEARALGRIERLRESAPEANIGVTGFDEYLVERRVAAETARLRGVRFDEPIFAIPRNRAVVTHGVHIYANLIDYNTHLTENARETPTSHVKFLRFLHSYYAGADQLIAAFGIQRIDFHGSRLHAVALTPTGDAQEADRVRNAISFAAAFRALAERMSAEFGDDLATRVRIGIDTGPAVAMSSGKRDELEPIFIGSPANHAAKAAAGDEPGIFLTPRAQAALHGGAVAGVMTETRMLDAAREASFLNADVFVEGRQRRVRGQVDEAYAALAADRSRLATLAGIERDAAICFHYRRPPLRTIVYAEHPPSNAIRMGMVSVFADIDGFTKYVDDAIRSGRIAEAVSNLHVMRGEMNYVLRDDFDGRKVRFIGDCLHGLVAVGDGVAIDERRSVRQAVLAAAGIRSSFELCRRMLPGAGSLGIAIGLELGVTPIARLGLRGDASVRCATSRSTCVSEEVQGACDAQETGIGEVAFAAADNQVKHLFMGNRRVSNLSYAAAATLLLGAAQTVAAAPAIQAVRQPLRAYARA